MPDTETKTPAGAADLSLEIAKAVLKKPREQVTCRRI
jgi:hypothetical protein